MLSMDITNIITASGVAVASLTFVGSVVQNRIDQTQQEAARTREDLQAIIGDSGRFLHPLIQESPYPILYTASTIINKLCGRLGKSPTGNDVYTLLQDRALLRSICVEGWIASNQVIRLMEMVEELERKASSHNLRGKLLLISQASFLLAGIVSKSCSPTYFFNTLYGLQPDCCQADDVEVILNNITVELQSKVCHKFEEKYKEPLILCLSFIQKASRLFMKLPDRKLVQFAKHSVSPPPTLSVTDASKMVAEPIRQIEQEASLFSRINQVQEILDCLAGGLKSRKYENEYRVLRSLIESLKHACIIIE